MSTPEILIAADSARAKQAKLLGTDAARRMEASAQARERLDRETLAFLRKVPLFSGLSRRHVRRVANLGRVVSFDPGRTIVERNARGDSFYLILGGRASVYHGVVPTGRAMARLKPGDFFGEMALLDGGPRRATVVSNDRLTALKIPRPAFRQLLLQEPLVALRILEAMAARTREHESSAPGH